MAKVFCAAGGSNTAPYDTWAKAATSLVTALAAAATPGDIVALDVAAPPTVDKEASADTTYTFAATNVHLICSTNSGVDTITPAVMGTSQWIGSSTGGHAPSFSAPGRSCFVYGLTVRVAGSTGAIIFLGVGSGAQITYQDCYLWQGASNSGQTIVAGGSNDQPSCVVLINPTIRFAVAGQHIVVNGRLIIVGGEYSSAGVSTTGGLFRVSTATDPGGSDVEAEGFDLSFLGANPICGNATTSAGSVRLTRCKLGSGFVGLASLTNPNLSNVELYLFDCAVGDTHGFFGYYNALGSCSSDFSIVPTTGDPAPGQSWKIVTTANACHAAPFRTPFIDFMPPAGGGAVTPRIEILRDGSSTAYTNAEVFGEFSVKVTSGSVAASYFNDGQNLANYAAGTAANQAAGAGLGAWSGEGGTAWSGKVDSGSAITPAEAGEIRGRVCVAIETTLYLEPVVRTA